MRTALLDSVVWIPKASVPEHRVQDLLGKVTSISAYADGDDEDGEVRTWVETKKAYGLPVCFGLRVAKHLNLTVKDARSDGFRFLVRVKPAARNPKQEEFFLTLTEAARRSPAVFSVAPTGTGKTVAALQTIATLGRTAIVIVPSKSLAHQWKDEAIKHLGMPASSVHVFEGGKCAWEGFRLVIAVIHNLCNREWPKEFYAYFGTAVWDEAHRVGAKVFSQSLTLFPAKHRIALTATPDRKDGRTSIITNYFGEPDATVKGTSMKALPCSVYIVNTDFRIKSRSYGNRLMQMGALISAVAAHNDRNLLICNLIWRGWSAGRNILVLSDRIEQLTLIRYSLINQGEIPEADIGMFIGSAAQDELDRIKADCRIILATYGMMKEGQDVPRVDMGVDATPRSEGVQSLGRIRREFPGKKTPIWVTLYDSNGSGLLKGISGARIKEYTQCGASVGNIGNSLSLIPF